MDIVTKESFKSKVQALVERFSNSEEFYKSKEYKEDQLRQEFINPFFKALGWDMDNEQDFAPQYREVIHEDRIEIEGKPKAPDYAFKVGSDRKFFVEAKAASVKVFSAIDPAFQLRRYAWSGRLPISILTDFEEFSVYDTTIAPKHSDDSSIARVKYIPYKDYLKNADYIFDTFSKGAVWKGSFDKFAAKEKKGSQLVDKSFLKEIELWRELIAKDVAENNDLSIYDLNYVVQKFIDRLIFLRIAEDRGIETYESLKSTVNSSDTYSQLLKIFKRADNKYDSSLFSFNEDKLSEKIKISDKILDRIINNLYYPRSPYEFSVIGVDILGSVYEQFLGKVIRLTKSGNAIVEEKPEVKKAGGVYYTPQYIVDYIVKNTVGELVKDKTPKEVAKLKIVDPACGSGSFLIGAYTYLLNWYHKYYVEHDVDKNLKAKKLFKDSEGNYFLSTQEKKDILLNNIHGVDIDPQAVEVTKLSLALKMLEGENSETIGAQFVLFADRILPDLSSNIKCGNSLIGNDYYANKQISLLGTDELRKVNAFDWVEEFPLVFRYGGFNVVIGNPPYVGMEEMNPELRKYTYEEDRYLSAVRKTNLYSIFYEKGVNLLTEHGILGFITPYSWISNSSYKELRKIIFKKTKVKIFIRLPYGIFENAGIATSVCLLSKTPPSIRDTISVFDWAKIKLNSIPEMFKEFKVNNSPYVPLKSIWNNEDMLFNIEYSENKDRLMKTIYKTNLFLQDVTQIDRGCDTANNDKYIGNLNDVTRNSKKLLEGANCDRWYYKWSGKYLYYLPEKMKKEKKTARPGDSTRFETTEKLIIERFLYKDGGLKSTYDSNSYYTLGSTYVLHMKDNKGGYDIKSILGILNSNLVRFLIKQNFKGVKITQNELGKIPLPEVEKLRLVGVGEISDRLVKAHITQDSRKEEDFAFKRYFENLQEELNERVYKAYELKNSDVNILKEALKDN